MGGHICGFTTCTHPHPGNDSDVTRFGKVVSKMALRAVPDHPKFAHLKTILALPKGALLGWLEAIWHFTGRFTPQGNIGKYTDREIEAWVEWNGEPGALVAALTESRWLEPDSTHRLLVHDWHEHADKATKQSLKNKHLQFYVPTMRPLGTQLEHTSQLAVQVCAPPVPGAVPEPDPGAVPGPVPVPPLAAKEPVSLLPTKPNLAHSAPDSVDNRILCETVGIFDMRQQSDMQKLYEAYVRSSRRDAESAREHMAARWVEYGTEAPRLEWQYGSAYKFYMSGKWDDPRSWPRGKEQMDVYERYMAQGG